MKFDLQKLVDLGVDLQTGIEYTGNKEKYVSALQRFYRSSEMNKKKIHEHLEAEDLENLAITVHALKSNAKMLGDDALSGMFETLENASKENDMATVQANIDEAMEAYERLLEVIKPWGEKEIYLATGELTADEAMDTAEKLLIALDDFDDDLASELAAKLSGYPFRITQRGKLQEAADLIDDFLYEEAADLIKEIKGAIE